jgi:hypothetical protein
MYSSNPNPPNTPEQGSTGGLKLDGRTVAIGVVVLLVLLFLGFQLFGNRGADSTAENQNPDTVQDNPNAGQPATNPSLGDVVVASSVDREGCPANSTTTFNSGDTIYVGVTNSDIPEGTDMFARLFYEGEPLEDTDLITADADYSCVAFAFEATNGAEVMESGSYEAQLFVNGNPGDSVSFEVR